MRKKLIAGKDSAYMSKRLAALMFDAPVALDLPAMDIARLDTAKLKAMLVKLEFRSLLRKLPDAMKDDTPAAVLDTNDVEEIEPGTAQAVLMMAPELVVWADGDDVWLSHERAKAARLPRAEEGNRDQQHA